MYTTNAVESLNYTCARSAGTVCAINDAAAYAKLPREIFLVL